MGARAQGRDLGQTLEPRYQPHQAPAEPAVDRRDARGSAVREPARAELVLGVRGRVEQVVRGDSGGPTPQAHSVGPAGELDLPLGAQAQRVPRTHFGGKEAPRAAQEGTQSARAQAVEERKLEAQAEDAPVALQMILTALVPRMNVKGWMSVLAFLCV